MTVKLREFEDKVTPETGVGEGKGKGGMGPSSSKVDGRRVKVTIADMSDPYELKATRHDPPCMSMQ